MSRSRSSRSNKRRRRRTGPDSRVLWGMAGVILLGTALLVGGHALVGGPTEPPVEQEPSAPAFTVQNPAAQGAETPQPGTEPAVPTQDPDLTAALDAALANATQTAPQFTDPESWNEAGKALLESLAADPKYANMGMTLDAEEGFPYLIAVNRAASTATVFATDEQNRYTVPFMAVVCSGGPDTPTGYWGTPVSYEWRLLVGPCYGQYATRIWDSYLFHSVPYYSQHKDDLEYDEFNKLGTPASLGCIRLAVVDVKWIYDNCPIGTPVVIYDDEANPGPMGKPGTIYTDPADESRRGWDPTDPDPANPWEDVLESGTTIRSAVAWAQWQANRESWQSSLTPTDLQGWSTDSSVVGTRG